MEMRIGVILRAALALTCQVLLCHTRGALPFKEVYPEGQRSKSS